ncbi:uncharacterized protein LOC113542684 [Pangasianodon hypophthalmus]|uniref:uncharacterized protein LOC113542684 n=1 Tax=Pangasianodon hypophthalmus TaxID=310915 RepID=UPI000F00D985|nr:uncharacterized protein LOC113542684 [Pangasianodon hypophthalmus]
MCSVRPSDSVARGDMPSTDLRLKMIILLWITVMLFNKIADSAQTKGISQPNSVISAGVGDNVTLHCFRLGEENTEPIVWYKQKVGHEPWVMVTVQQEPKYENEFKPPKFNIEKEKEKGSFHLKIANVEPSDEATYYCGLRDFLTRFGNGTFLAVTGDGDVKVSVLQSSVLDSVPAGASVTLQCSVLSESRAADLQVLWFRAAPSQSHPQIIYTHHNSSHQCESGSSTHTCVYNFSKNILSLNDTGTYYCAVTVCGKIIFGNGTQVQLERSVDSVVICLAVALGLCVVVIFALIFVLSKRRNSEQCKVRLKQGSVRDKTLNQDCDNVELNYAALHFNERRAKRGKVKKQQPQDIIYSDVRGPSVT